MTDSVVNDPGETHDYRIGSHHWPGVGKVIEEQNELGTVFGKLMGSGGSRHHWSGDLVLMMQDEIADLRAALRFLEESNALLDQSRAGHGCHFGSGRDYMARREAWKLDLFRAWHRKDTANAWPDPKSYGLPPRE